MMMTYRWLTLAAALAGCNILGPRLETSGRTRLEPVPAEYVAWHAEVQACLDRTVDETPSFAQIEWYVASELYLGGSAIGGAWSPPARITLRRDHVGSEPSVKHELVHYIEQVAQHGPEFLRCSGVGA